MKFLSTGLIIYTILAVHVDPLPNRTSSIFFEGERVTPWVKHCWQDPDIVYQVQLSLNEQLSAAVYNDNGLSWRFWIPFY